MNESGIRVPGDKSISHRALILASLATGESHIRGILNSADVQSTAAILRSLGVEIPELGGSVRIKGVGLNGLSRPDAPLDAGNSGTTTRLMAGVTAASPFSSRFIGDASLSRRPMKRVSEPLTAMGARFEFANGDGLPMTVHGGQLKGIHWNTGGASAQTKSAILLAGLVARVRVAVSESRKSRDHTERMLESLGVSVSTDELSVTLAPVESLNPLDTRIPGDPSSAAYMVALGLLRRSGEVLLPNVCMNATRIGFLETVVNMGGTVLATHRRKIAGDDSATLIVRPSSLREIKVSGDIIPSMIDELPLLACVAAAAGVALEVTDAAELRVKESDRIASVVKNLRAIGANASELPDGFFVEPGDRPLKGLIQTEGDHRIAMSFGVLAALSGNSIEIDDRACVSVSYPQFWSDVDRIVSQSH